MILVGLALDQVVRLYGGTCEDCNSPSSVVNLAAHNKLLSW